MLLHVTRFIRKREKNWSSWLCVNHVINSNVSKLLPLTCINLMNRSNVGEFCLNNLSMTFHGQWSFEFLKIYMTLMIS